MRVLSLPGLLLLAAPLHAQIRVDDDAIGAGDGSSWQDAYTDLQAALKAAPPGEEIWVAQGTYRPSRTLDRKATFVISGESLYGGFAGHETSLDQRAGLFDRTVLTGDLAGDDGPGFVGRAENSLHVVANDGTSMLLDGFTIRGGNADTGTHWERRGGGLRLEFYFVGEIRNCTFVENEALAGGGAVASWMASETYRNCTFLDNRTAGRGAAIWAFDLGYRRIEGCRFHGNVATGAGGGAVSFDDNTYGADVVNSVFTANSADGSLEGGGALRAATSLVDLVNCTVYGNTATHTGGVLCGSGSDVTVRNSILWHNADLGGTGQLAQVKGASEVTHSCVQSWDGKLVIGWNPSSDPRLFDPDGEDDVLGTRDDDLRLRALSPCVDVADAALYAKAKGPDHDLAGDPRRVDSLACDGTGAALDIGAYERQTVDGTTNHCPAEPSSLGVPAVLAAPCAPSVAANDLTLTVDPLPKGTAFLLLGPRVDRTLLGEGVLCLGGGLLSSAAQRSSGGPLAFALDLTAPPGDAIEVGTTWGFQVLYRDFGAAGAGFNLSDAVRCTFRP